MKDQGVQVLLTGGQCEAWQSVEGFGCLLKHWKVGGWKSEDQS